MRFHTFTSVLWICFKHFFGLERYSCIWPFGSSSVSPTYDGLSEDFDDGNLMAVGLMNHQKTTYECLPLFLFFVNDMLVLILIDLNSL